MVFIFVRAHLITVLVFHAQSGPHIVKVKAPLYTRVCMAVDITHGMTAGDIVLKLQKRSRLNKDVIRRRVSGFNFTESFFKGTSSPVDDSEDSKDVNPGEQFVFEVGGNIGELNTMRLLLVYNYDAPLTSNRPQHIPSCPTNCY